MRKNFFIKMILISLVPAIGILFYSSIYAFEKYKMLDELDHININVKYVQKAEKLLNNIQKERGLSATYITSKGNLFNNELKEQRKSSDIEIENYLNFIKTDYFKSISNKSYIKDIQEKLFNLLSLRKRVINFNISFEEELKKYNKLTNAIINSMAQLLLEEKNQIINKKLYSIINIITAKEYAGLERAMLSNSFYDKSKITQEQYNKTIKFIAFQNNNLMKFKTTIDVIEFDFFNKKINNLIVEKLEEYRKDFFNNQKDEYLVITPEKWWKLSTQRIEALGEVISYFINKVIKQSNIEKDIIYKNLLYSLLFYTIVLILFIISFIMIKKLTTKEQENFYNLNKLKQIYNILSNTNELIIYDYKMKEVLKQACILTTKELDLSITFICMLDDNSELNIVEYSKKDNCNIIDFIKPDNNNTLYKKAFFEHQNIVIDNIFRNKSSLDFSIEKKNNIKSIAVYPLYNNDMPVGVLAFCSSQVNYFDKEIITVFEKMANDLSYGIEKETKENTKLKYEEELRIAAYAFDSQEAMAITDIDATIVKVNNAFTKITGYKREEVLGQNPSVLQSGKHDKEFYETMWNALKEEGVWSGELYNKRKNGEIYPEQTAITAIKNKNGQVTHYIAQFFDISEFKLNQEKLIYEVEHDTLTGLYNRVVLNKRLNQSIIAANRHSHFGAVLFLDLDNFKYINDSLGHDVGDKLLKKIANILTEISREDDLVVRLGGDEFIILVHNIGESRQQGIINIEKFAYKIKDALNTSLEIESIKLTTTTSIGIALFPEFDKSSEDIIKNADSAMYLAKNHGKNTVMFYYEDLDSQSKNYLKIENDLRDALNNDEFELYYQAKYNYKTKKIVGYEALIRWNHPSKGLLYPDYFIHVAEQSSLIINIGSWVLATCCMQINNWLDEGVDLSDVKISVNISSLELEQVDFIDKIKNILNKTNLDPKYLDLEITETGMFKNIDLVITKLTELKKLGIHTSIDDFGVGFSSLNYISKLPVNTIKLDKSFIMEKDASVNETIIDMVINITKKLEIDLIIEGVETIEDIKYLENKNSYVYQGFYISRAIKANEAIKLLVNKFKI